MKINLFKNYTKREIAIHIFMYFIGVALLPAGIVLTINSHFGAGGMDALNFAFGTLIHLPTSISIFILGAIYMCISALIRRQRPRLLTFMASVFQGIFVDLWKIILMPVESSNTLSAVLLFLLGNLIIAITAAPYYLSLLPSNPADDLTIAISEKGIRISIAKIIFECSCAVLAFLLHGEVNIGTILVILFLGPCIDIFQTFTKKFLDKRKIRYNL